MEARIKLIKEKLINNVPEGADIEWFFETCGDFEYAPGEEIAGISLHDMFYTVILGEKHELTIMEAVEPYIKKFDMEGKVTFDKPVSELECTVEPDALQVIK